MIVVEILSITLDFIFKILITLGYTEKFSERE